MNQNNYNILFCIILDSFIWLIQKKVISKNIFMKIIHRNKNSLYLIMPVNIYLDVLIFSDVLVRQSSRIIFILVYKLFASAQRHNTLLLIIFYYKL